MEAGPVKKVVFGGAGVSLLVLAGVIAAGWYLMNTEWSSEQSKTTGLSAANTQTSTRMPINARPLEYTFPKEGEKKQPEQKVADLPYDIQKPPPYVAPPPKQAPKATQKQQEELRLGFGVLDDGAEDKARNVVPASATGVISPQSAIDGIGRQELPAARQNLVRENRSFLDNASRIDGDGVIDGRLQASVSDMILQPGVIIPLRALNAASTRQPGGLAAEVIYDIKDSLTQSCVLIPAGTIAYGPVNSQVAYAAESMQAPVTRLHFPETGDIIDIGGMPATGMDGKPGVDGHVNRHIMQMAFAILGEAAVQSLSQAGQIFGNGEQTIVNVGTTATANSAGSVVSEIARRQLDLQNEIYIDQGDITAFMTTRVIPLPPFQGRCD